jgi:hypothetical protein
LAPAPCSHEPGRYGGEIANETGRDEADVVDDSAGHRFVLHPSGDAAELVYEVDGSRLTLVHTYVPVALRRRGVAARLVRAAVRRAAAEGLTVEPSCPYVRWWLKAHPEEAAPVAIDWGT